MAEKLQDSFAYPPRWMRADRAAGWLDLSKTKFLELVDEGKLPFPVRIERSLPLWDRYELDAAIDALRGQEAAHKANPIEAHYGVGQND